MSAKNPRRSAVSIIFPALILLLTLALSAVAQAQTQAQGKNQDQDAPVSPAAPPIVIGAVFNQSGGFAAIDAPSLNGLALGVMRINRAGGVLGRPLKIVTDDTESSLNATARITSELISRFHPVILTGYNDSDFALAAGRTASKAGLPFVSTGATLPGLPAQAGPGFFMAAFGDDAQAKALAAYAAKELHARTFWMLSDQSFAFTRALDGYFRKAASKRSMKIAARARYKSGDTDFGRQIAALRKACPRPDAIFVAAVPPDAGNVVRALRQAGMTQPILSGDGFDSPQLLEQAGGAATDIHYATHAALDDPAPGMAAFVRAYREYFWTDPENAFAVLGFDTAHLIADAILRAGSAEPAAIRAALAATKDFRALSGTISYAGGQGQPRKAVTIVRVREGRAGFAASVPVE